MAEPGGVEIVTAVFTVVLALATIGLFLATQKLWQTTKALADKTREDFTRRKIQDTVRIWKNIRELVPPGGLPRLDQYAKPSDEMRSILTRLEYFSACVNGDVYDLQIFTRLSGSWFLQQYERIAPYVESRRNPVAFVDLKELRKRVHRAGPGGGTTASYAERDK